MFQANPRLKIQYIKQITIQRQGTLSVRITTHFLLLSSLSCFAILLFVSFVVALFSQCSLFSDREPYGAHFGSKQIYKEPTTLRPVFRI